ncbi:hypothetical protein B0T11DRAFT_275861 [Plectosphaerella cucumerina]|uniref:Uncharacterized protein n=1 Tax=Plectosphaerella cucumerina TaxID=40658 RepID=A0A8K0TNC7_9PEZI|nr:hypothetical protein B0T11DRAFT_275861 [Plectosphaerella cucumerina]
MVKQEYFPSWAPSTARDADWERPLDAVEIFYRRMTPKGAGCYPVTACASVNISSDPETSDFCFKSAWTILRREYPPLGSRVSFDPANVTWMRRYSQLDTAAESAWLSSTFLVVENEEGPEHWFNNAPPAFELSSLFLVKPRGEDANYTVFLRCPHDLTDGVGTLHLLNRFLLHAGAIHEHGQHYASTVLLPEDESSALSPSLQVDAMFPSKPSLSLQDTFKGTISNNGAIYNHPGLLSLPASSAANDQEGTHRAAVSIPLPTSCQIVDACKSIGPGISVTHVFLAGLAQTLAELQPQRDEPYEVRYANQFLMDLRPQLPAPFDGPKHAAAAYSTVSAQAMNLDLVAGAQGAAAKLEEFRRCAIDARDFFHAVRPTSLDHEQVQLTPLVFNSLADQAGPNPHATSDPAFCPVALSSLGVLDKVASSRHGSLTVDNVWVASEPIGAGVAAFLGSWAGKMELSVVFRKDYHDVEYLEDFLGRIVDNVLLGLNIGEPFCL